MTKILRRIKQIREMYHPFRWPFLCLFLLIVGIQCTNMTVPYFLGKIVDKVIKHQGNPWIYALCILAALLTKNILDRIHGYFHVSRIAYDSEVRIEEKTLRRVLQLSIGQIMNHNSGFRHEILKKGSDAIRSLVETIVLQVIPYLCRIIIAISALFYLHLYLGLIAI